MLEENGRYRDGNNGDPRLKLGGEGLSEAVELDAGNEEEWDVCCSGLSDEEESKKDVLRVVACLCRFWGEELICYQRCRHANEDEPCKYYETGVTYWGDESFNGWNAIEEVRSISKGEGYLEKEAKACEGGR